MSKLSDLQFHCQVVADNHATAATTLPFQDLVKRQMAEQLAERIIQQHMNVAVGEFATTFKMDALVMDYETFHKHVRKAAAQVQLDPARYLFDLLQPERN